MPAPDDASGDLPVTGSLVVPAAALHWRFSRSSGPGGQGVNTADSRVELSVAPLERALTWHRILLGVHAGERAGWQASVPGWAAETAEPGPLAGVPGA